MPPRRDHLPADSGPAKTFASSPRKQTEPIRATAPTPAPTSKRSRRYDLQTGFLSFSVILVLLCLVEFGVIGILVAKSYEMIKQSTTYRNPLHFVNADPLEDYSLMPPISRASRDKVLMVTAVTVGGAVLLEIGFLSWLYMASRNCHILSVGTRYFSGTVIRLMVPISLMVVIPVGPLLSLLEAPQYCRDYAPFLGIIPALCLVFAYWTVQEIWKISEDPEQAINQRDAIYVFLWMASRMGCAILATAPFHTAFDIQNDLGIHFIGIMIYLLVYGLGFLCTILLTNLLIVVVTLRQYYWSRVEPTRIR